MPEAAARIVEALAGSGVSGVLVLVLLAVLIAFVWMLREVLKHLASERESRDQAMATCHKAHAELARENRESHERQSRVVVEALDRANSRNQENSRVLGEVGKHLEACAQTHRDLERAIRERGTAPVVQPQEGS